MWLIYFVCFHHLHPGPLCCHGSISIPAWIGSHLSSKLLDGINCPFTNFKNNFTAHFIVMKSLVYTGIEVDHVRKRVPGTKPNQQKYTLSQNFASEWHLLLELMEQNFSKLPQGIYSLSERTSYLAKYRSREIGLVFCLWKLIDYIQQH